MSDILVSWVDGIPGAVVPVDDRGLQYGDGLFETMLIRHGRVRFLEAHLARLAQGCLRLGIPLARGRRFASGDPERGFRQRPRSPQTAGHARQRSARLRAARPDGSAARDDRIRGRPDDHVARGCAAARGTTHGGRESRARRHQASQSAGECARGTRSAARGLLRCTAAGHGGTRGRRLDVQCVPGERRSDRHAARRPRGRSRCDARHRAA